MALPQQTDAVEGYARPLRKEQAHYETIYAAAVTHGIYAMTPQENLDLRRRAYGIPVVADTAIGPRAIRFDDQSING